MQPHKPIPVESVENLRARLDRLFRVQSKRSKQGKQASLNLSGASAERVVIAHPSKDIAEFLDFLTAVLPDGDVYLFGGVLRDMALLGRRGFNSDIDLVVEGAWESCVSYLETLGARKNKFGGYRLNVGDWPVDIWEAKQTWAIKEGLVPYKGIASLTETTVLNWDAILMNWRTKNFVSRKNYFEELRQRVLDVVLEQNPNPLGMAVRVFRHLFLKDAAKISERAARYLAHCARTYSYEEIQCGEIASYGSSVIEAPLYRLFAHLKAYEELDIRDGFSIARDVLKMELDLSYYRVGQ